MGVNIVNFFVLSTYNQEQGSKEAGAHQKIMKRLREGL